MDWQADSSFHSHVLVCTNSHISVLMAHVVSTHRPEFGEEGLFVALGLQPTTTRAQGLYR